MNKEIRNLLGNKARILKKLAMNKKKLDKAIAKTQDRVNYLKISRTMIDSKIDKVLKSSKINKSIRRRYFTS